MADDAREYLFMEPLFELRNRLRARGCDPTMNWEVLSESEKKILNRPIHITIIPAEEDVAADTITVTAQSSHSSPPISITFKDRASEAQ
jgi:hypothetical protein